MAVPQPGGGEAAGRIQEHRAHDWADVTGGAVRYIIKDLSMALEVGDGQEEEANVLPGSALCRQMFSAMAATGDGELCLYGVITVVERLNDIHNDDLAQEVTAASELSGEKFWRLPMEESYWEQMKYGVADMVNTGGRQGGSITAALFPKQV
ncbi:hypothetical protein ZWY2020_000584 [Hordeum vulgare]|nr:hypothetical protein ZWY2020_000584 [Hordeum vulgare]